MGLNKMKRLWLDEKLKELCPNVYYQPTSNVQMKYPAIRYKRVSIDVDHADNVPYISAVGYEITVIDRDPDSEIVEEIAKMQYASHNRHYTAENLNHDTFIIYV